MAKRNIILMLDSSRAADRGIIRGVINYANLRGQWSFCRFSPLFKTYPFSREPAAKDDIWQKLVNLDADGIIGYLPDDQDLIDKIRSSRFPAVVQPINSRVEGIVNICQDDSTGVMAAEYFLGLGFRSIAFCGMSYSWSKAREQAYVKTVMAAGCEVSVLPDEISSVEELSDWLTTLELPVAIMACNDERASEVVEACHIAKLEIPQQVAVIGVDNDDMICSLSNPPISSIQLNFETVGYNAAEVIDKMLTYGNEEQYPDILYLPTDIVTRASTDILEIDDIEVANAIRFIRNNARRAITVADVHENSYLSLRSLQLRFKKAINRSINEEIRRERMFEMGRQLLNTNLTVYQISYNIGFEDVNHVSRIFKKVTGMTPVEYRRKLGKK